MKTLITLVATAFISFGFTPGAFAAGMDKSTGMDKSATSNANGVSAEAKDLNPWIGKDVRNTQGEDLGEVKEFVRDENGDVSLVIISHFGEKDVAAPFNALSFPESGDYAILDVIKEQLANAPAVGADENLTDRAFAEDVYRHFGERPYWAEEGGAAYEGMKKDEGTTHEYFGTDRDIDDDSFGSDRDLDPRGGTSLDSDWHNY